VPSRRDKRAATKFLRKLPKRRTYVPRVVITDKRATTLLAQVDNARAAAWYRRGCGRSGHDIAPPPVTDEAGLCLPRTPPLARSQAHTLTAFAMATLPL
jgi:hypothetical protein